MSSFKVLKFAANGNHFLVVILLLGLVTGPTRCQDDEEEGGGEGEEEEEAPAVEKVCQQHVFELVIGALPQLPKCLFGQNKLNFRLQHIFEALPRFYCVVKCILGELGTLGEDGLLDEVAALLWFQDAFPEYAIGPIVEKAQPCLALAAGFKPKEYFCQSYSPFVQCLTGVGITAIGPFILDCFGTPSAGAFFGVLNFFVPPAPPGKDEGERRRIIAGPRNTTKTNLNFTRLAKILFSPQVLLGGRVNSTTTSRSRTQGTRRTMKNGSTSSTGTGTLPGNQIDNGGSVKMSSSQTAVPSNSLMNSFWNSQKSSSSNIKISPQNYNSSISNTVLLKRFTSFANTFFNSLSTPNSASASSNIYNNSTRFRIK